MKFSQKIAASLAVLAITGLVLYVTRRRCSDNTKMLNVISDEGYETANDVLFPGKKIQGRHLKYGPVIPNQ